MNNKALTLSLIMAVVAVFFVQSYVTSIEEEAKKKFGTEVNVVVARRDIKEMETINQTLLEFKVLPKNFVEPAAIFSEKKGEIDEKERDRNYKSLVGTVAVVPIKKGEQITFNKLTDPSMRTGLSPQIAPGRRAVALLVNEITGVAKLLKPGDRVDLIAVMNPGGGKENKIAKTLMQDVVILSTGRYVTNNVARTIEADPGGGKDKIRSLAEDYSFTAVTVEVDPVQAQALALITTMGDSSIVFSLRNNDDTERNPNLPTLMVSDVLGIDVGRAKGAGKR